MKLKYVGSGEMLIRTELAGEKMLVKKGQVFEAEARFGENLIGLYGYLFKLASHSDKATGLRAVKKVVEKPVIEEKLEIKKSELNED